mmetsp:Transcript_11735/g.11441  ORF Transcript_11735/g.11441 Transcript_11735/m.11441 type:complete len:170 (+) Transcript_11735:171-680(+)
MSEDHPNSKVFTDSTFTIEDIEDDDECVIEEDDECCVIDDDECVIEHVHDQLPSVEEIKSSQAKIIAKSKRRKQRCIAAGGVGVVVTVSIVSGAFLAWSAIDIYFGFPIPFKPILLTVSVDLVLCYCMIRCYDPGNYKKHKKQLSPSRNEEDEEEIDFSSLPVIHTHTS